MRTVLLPLLLVLSACATGASLPLADGPADEMQPLRRMIGDWSSEWEQPEDGAAPPTRPYGEVRIRWVLGGRYLERDGWYVIGDQPRLDFRELVAWDAERGCFQSWYFDSAGQVSRGTVRAADDGRRLQLQMGPGGGDGQGTMTFEDADTMTWVWRTPDGAEVAGTNRRL